MDDGSTVASLSHELETDPEVEPLNPEGDTGPNYLPEKDLDY
jgi:hypothetical protein